MKYKYIIDYLCQTVGPSIDGAGSSDERVNKRTEAGMAIAFRRYVCGIDGDEGCDFFKVDDDDQLFVFNGRHFEIIKEEVLQEIMLETMSEMNVGIVYQANSAKTIKDFCMNKLKSDERCLFKADRRYVCFKNGIFDVETGKLSDFSVKFKTDIILDFDYKAGMVSALWDKVLAQTVPDISMRETFHQFCGCFLAKRGDYKIEYICFVVGEGQNGKSIICKAVINTLGRGVASAYSPEQLFKSSQAEYHLADVNGKIVNYCDDVSKKDFSGGDFKQFVSGGEFVGRHPYSKRPTKVDKIPLMLCCANNIPPTTDDTEGYFRRFLVIIAPNHIDERDKDVTLEKKLQADDVRASIFNWIYSGYKTFVANGGKIDVASSVKDVIEEMKNTSNSLRRWISEFNYGKVEPEGATDARWKPLRDWCKEYITYCNDFGETPKNKNAVTEMFKKMDLAKVRRSDGMWYCMGVVMPEEPKVVEKKQEDDMPAFDLEAALPF